MSSARDQVTITFEPSGLSRTVKRGRQLLAIIRESGLPIGYSCRGQGVCTACVVRVLGEANPISNEEAQLIERVAENTPTADGALRVACLVRVDSDLTVRADYW